jgi:hypothetical protein
MNDGYVIHGCWPAFTRSPGMSPRRILGTDVGIEINAYDECHTEPNFQDRYGRERPRRCRPE